MKVLCSLPHTYLTKIFLNFFWANAGITDAGLHSAERPSQPPHPSTDVRTTEDTSLVEPRHPGLLILIMSQNGSHNPSSSTSL